MAKAATRKGTRRSRTMEHDQLQRAARRQFPDAPGHVVAHATRTLHRLAGAGRLRLDPGPRP